MTLEEMRAKLKGFLDSAQAIIDTAEKDGDEGRNLTDEESKQYEQFVADAKAMTERAERQDRSASWKESTGRKIAPEQPKMDDDKETRTKSTETREAARIVIPASARYRGSLRNFVDRPGRTYAHNAEERAYRFGRFLFSILGHRASQEWCVDHGLELRVHQEKVNTTGGYLVPEEIDGDLIDLREQYGVARQYCKNIAMTSDTKKINRRSGGLTAYAVGEGDQGTESTKSWDQVNLVAKDWMVLSRMSNDLTEDAVINVADDLAGEIGYAFAQKEDDCLWNGDGTSTYHGIIGIAQSFLNLTATRANIAGAIIGGGTGLWSDLTLANFNHMVGLLPTFGDTPNAAWYCHKTFYGQVMQVLEYAAGGNTTLNMAAGVPQTFLGYPVRFIQTAPKVTSVDTPVCVLGDLGLSAAFGDRRQTTIAFTDSATVNSISVFEYNEMAIRGTERYDINVHDVGNQSATASLKEPGPIVALITDAS